MRQIFHFHSNNRGFSLVEVAIAIVVIGLVIGFTIKGKELIQTAKLNAVVEQVNSFKAATQIFVEKYGFLPGDFANAKDVISASVDNGNGDGKITDISSAKRFWSHLVAADLISVEVAANGLPISKIGGCYSVSSDVGGANDGVWVILSMGTTDNKSFQGIISQEEAYRIDKKNDTSNPATGDIRTCRAGGLTTLTNYDPKNKTKDCVIMFRVW